jgi:4-aminobutyrate aminotransferase-like enzyme/Ser/Thr protein kinase RdoA (MazF antagonist)
MNKHSKIGIKQVENFLLENYGLKGKAFSLLGEIDLNFRIELKKEPRFILKITDANEKIDYLSFQIEILNYLENCEFNIVAPKIIANKNAEFISFFNDLSGNKFNAYLLTWIAGRLWSTVNPITDQLLFKLGQQCGALTKALISFDHPMAHRQFEWDIANGLWTKQHLKIVNKKQQDLLAFFINKFEASLPSYLKLRQSVVHNDANDNNIIISSHLLNPTVNALIDYGDAVNTQIINDLAVACSYAIMDKNDPLSAALPIIKGYHNSFSLNENELAHLYISIGMRLVISVTKSALNKIDRPQNDYLTISEKSAWTLLEQWKLINEEFAHYCFRQSCGYPAHPSAEKFNHWGSKNKFNLSDLFPSKNTNQIRQLDLSVSSTWIGTISDLNNLDLFQFKIDQLQKQNPNKIIAGGYLEPRPVYTSEAFEKVGNHGRENRTVHLGIDFWLPAGTPVHALLDGEVIMAVNNDDDKEYGGFIVLKHSIQDLIFYSLYGHLSVKSATSKKVGDKIKKGEQIAILGNSTENGNWVPHLHFQIMLSLLDYKNDFPGVAYNKEIEIWKGICPDPNLLFKLNSLTIAKITPLNNLLNFRNKHLGKSLSLQYDEPLKIVRGCASYLMDPFGRKYLDTVNNVAHVGHEAPQVVKAGQKQMAVLNTNTRYLHDNIKELADALMETLPPALNVFHFVNSGSEANELALRMVKTYNGQNDIIASEAGYHGNSNLLIDISSYKFEGNGLIKPEHTHVFPLPDSYRGKYKGKNSGKKYADEVQKQIKNIHHKGRQVGALIVEPIISCGGQIELPEGFLDQAYAYIRKAGGLCISDEVQTGCGRMGKTFWGFQLYNVIPDIVTIGKPLGNGHPVAAVVCTQEVAHKFAHSMEYFNTFGGNPVSCAIGTAVLKTIKTEKLQEHALSVGTFLKGELKKLALKFPIIGEVRGQGLFLGVELVDNEMIPLKEHAHYLVNRMKEYGILMSIDGPDHNVLKIKPPMVFSIANARELIFSLNLILAEDFMKIN